jgi:hypothetical protein
MHSPHDPGLNLALNDLCIEAAFNSVKEIVFDGKYFPQNNIIIEDNREFCLLYFVNQILDFTKEWPHKLIITLGWSDNIFSIKLSSRRIRNFLMEPYDSFQFFP